MSITAENSPIITKPASAGPPAGVAGESDGARKLTIIAPRSGWQAIDVRELWRYRDLLYYLAWRDVKVRYKQTVLGAAWAIIQPVLTMIVFSVFFGNLGGMNHQVDVPYPIFVYAGILPWGFFSAAVAQCAQSVIGSSNLVSKVYFPRLIVPFASVGAALVDFAISFGVMFLLMLIYGVSLSAQLWLIPGLVVATLMVALGVGAGLAALTVTYRDFRYVVPFLIQLWMLASPVAYPMEVIPPAWRLAYALNPLAGLISGYRSALLGTPLHVGPLAVSCLVAVVCFALGCAYFRRIERRFADIV
jgi:lipopolysaccharide transport system permease protein